MRPRHLHSRYHRDASALAAADVGIALGAAGTDVALETADVFVMGDEASEISRAVDLSRRARAVVRQNLIFPTSVIVVFNGLRPLRDRAM